MDDNGYVKCWWGDKLGLTHWKLGDVNPNNWWFIGWDVDKNGIHTPSFMPPRFDGRVPNLEHAKLLGCDTEMKQIEGVMMGNPYEPYRQELSTRLGVFEKRIRDPRARINYILWCKGYNCYDKKFKDIDLSTAKGYTNDSHKSFVPAVVAANQFGDPNVDYPATWFKNSNEENLFWFPIEEEKGKGIDRDQNSRFEKSNTRKRKETDKDQNSSEKSVLKN
jgi:hypothetical protein